MKRQIIKTRPQRPYTVARVVLLIIACVVVAAIAYALWARAHAPVHGAMAAPPARQDLAIFSMKPRSPVIVC